MSRNICGLLGRYWLCLLGQSLVPVCESGARTPSRVCQLLCPPYRQMGTVAHSQPHATITPKLFCFSSNAENKTVVFSSPPALGAGGPRFKSARPDQIYLPYFRGLKENAIHVKLHCGSQADRRSGCASRLIPKSSPRDEFARMRGGRRANQKPLNESKLSARNLASMGKIRGTQRISRYSIWSKAHRCSHVRKLCPLSRFVDRLFCPPTRRGMGSLQPLGSQPLGNLITLCRSGNFPKRISKLR